MDAKQKELVAKIRKTQNMIAGSAIIQVLDSDLYDGAPTRAFILTVIAFMQMREEDSNYPEDAPDEYKENRIGWCWASQKTLALRCRCSEKYVYESIKQFKADGVIITREWTDDNNTPHLEYHAVEDVVIARKRQKDVKPKRKTSRVYKPNKGSFKRRDGRIHGPTAKNSQLSSQNSQPTLENSQPSSQELSAILAMKSQPTEMAESAVQGVSQGVSTTSGGFGVSSSSQGGTSGSVPPSAGRPSPSASDVPSQEQVKSDKGSLAQGSTCSVCWRTDGTHHKRCTEIKPKVREEGKVVGGFKSPLPNKKSSPQLNWNAARVPKCPRCGGWLHANEYHVNPDYNPGMDAAAYKAHGYDVTICEGYTPKFKPVVDSRVSMEDQREEYHELIANARAQRSKHECKRCGEPLLNEEHAIEHIEECPSYTSL